MDPNVEGVGLRMSAILVAICTCCIFVSLKDLFDRLAGPCPLRLGRSHLAFILIKPEPPMLLCL
jgi:hypothetical protein